MTHESINPNDTETLKAVTEISDAPLVAPA